MKYFPYRNIYALVSAVSAKKWNKTDYRYLQISLFKSTRWHFVGKNRSYLLYNRAL